MKKDSLAALIGIVALAGAAGAAERPQGFRFLDNHLVFQPYLSFFYTYDSNIDTARHSVDDSIFSIEPGTTVSWIGDRWALDGSLWYRHQSYAKYNDCLGEDSYGESLRLKYTSSGADEKGWSALVGERFSQMSQADDINSRGGRGIWRDREQMDATGGFEYRFSPRFHVDAQGQYSRLNYQNNAHKYVPLHGWDQYSAGLEAGYAFTRWTDVLLAGGYSHYKQDGGRVGDNTYSDRSESYTVQAGLGSRATERISYRALTGISWLDYGGESNADCGWTYSLSGDWRATRQLKFSIVGSSYYQPSERNIGQAVKVYSLGVGASYLTMGDRLTLTANLLYRLDKTAYSDHYYSKRSDYDETVLSARLGADYLVNQYMSVFANVYWEEEWCDNSNSDYDYDRFRGTVGVRLHY